ncbi:hypothetical protein [Acidihalobacter prosperus]
MFESQHLKDHIKQELIVPFTKIVLQRKDMDKRHRFVGSGELDCTQKGRLHLSGFFKNTEGIEIVERDWSNAGKLVPKRHMYELTAVDLTGKRWIAEQVHVSERNVCDGVHHIKLILHKIQMGDVRRVRGMQLILYFNRRFRHFFNAATNEHKDDNTSLTLLKRDIRGSGMHVGEYQNAQVEMRFDEEKESNLNTFSVAYKQPAYIKYGPWRLYEALSFIYCENVQAYAEVYRVGIGETLVVRPHQRNSVGTPNAPFSLISGAYNCPDDYWAMFLSYLNYRQFKKGYRRDRFLNLALNQIYIAEARQIDWALCALTIATAIEDMLHNYVFENLECKYPDDSNRLNETLKGYKEILKPIKGKEEDLYGRLVCETKRFLLAQSTEEYMRGLRTMNFITSFQYSAWQTRNKLAHGNKDVIDMNNKSSFTLGGLLVMYNRLCFLTIGYIGRYTDYSKEGHGTREHTATLEEVRNKMVKYVARIMGKRVVKNIDTTGHG